MLVFCKMKTPINSLKILFISLALLVLLVECSQAQNRDTDDIVNWNDVNLILPLIKEKEADKVSITFSGVLRIGRNLKRPIDKRIGANLNYRINKHFSTSIGYLYRRSRPTERPSQLEHRLTFALLAERKWKHFALRNRLMTMYQIRQSNSNLIVQRNRVQFSFPIRKNKSELFAPFITDEVYYDFRTKRLFRNDIFIGITTTFSKKLSADFFYIKQNLSSGQIKETNGFGISLRIRLKK